MVLGYDDGRYIFASAICIFVHNNKTNVIVLHIYFLLLFSIKCNNTQIIDEYQKKVLSASKYSEGLGTPSKRPSHWKYSHGKWI